MSLELIRPVLFSDSGMYTLNIYRLAGYQIISSCFRVILRLFPEFSMPVVILYIENHPGFRINVPGHV